MTAAGFEPTTLRSEGICLATFSAFQYFLLLIFFPEVAEEFKICIKSLLQFFGLSVLFVEPDEFSRETRQSNFMRITEMKDGYGSHSCIMFVPGSPVPAQTKWHLYYRKPVSFI